MNRYIVTFSQHRTGGDVFLRLHEVKPWRTRTVIVSADGEDQAADAAMIELGKAGRFWSVYSVQQLDAN
jgi:hypothetical protein